MPREIVISAETQADIKRLCETYRQSACYCYTLARIERVPTLGCMACVSKRILAAIEPTTEVLHATDRP